MAVSEAQYVGLSKRIGGQLNIAVDNGLLVNADPATDTTLTTLKARLDTRFASADASIYPEVVKTKQAIDAGEDIGLFSATHGVSTVAALIALTDASVDFRQGIRG